MKKCLHFITILLLTVVFICTPAFAYNYPVYGETEVDLSIFDDYVELLSENNIKITIPDITVNKLSDADWIYTETANSFYLNYIWFLDGSSDSFTLEVPVEYELKDMACILLISYYLSMDEKEAEACFNDLRFSLVDGKSETENGEYSIYYAESSWDQSIRIERRFVSNVSDIISLIEKQNDLCVSMEQTVKTAIKEFDNVELNSCSVVLDSDTKVKTAQIRLTWDYENGAERTKTMLELFTNDIVVTIHQKYPDLKFDALWLFWETPYVVKIGVAAKYKYVSRGDKLYLVDSLGPLYGKN